MKNLYPRLSRISLKDWLEYHPYHREVFSDQFYIGLCNHVQHEMLLFDEDDHLVGADYKYLACMLTCFFEDMVSQTGIWQSFTHEHYRLYGKYLPFYDMAGYDPDDVNMADLQFLIWHFCSNLSIHSRFVDPFSIENTELAQLVYHILDEAADQAPVNENLKAALTLEPDADMDTIYRRLDFFFFGCYLNHYYMASLMKGEILDVRNRKGTQKDIDERRAHVLLNRVSPLLAQRSGEMLAHWIGESHPLYPTIMSISKRTDDDLFTQMSMQLGIVRRAEVCFLELNNNNRIVFLESKRTAFTFIDNLWEAFHLKYGMESLDRKMFDVHHVTVDIDEDLENLTVFFNPHSGMEFYPNIAQCISIWDNIYFNKYTEANIESLIMDDRVSSDFITFLIKNQLIEIEPLSGKGGYHYVWANVDFLLRYWKKERYISEPEMSIE